MGAPAAARTLVSLPRRLKPQIAPSGRKRHFVAWPRPRFVVAQTGHSGSKYTAAVFTAAGLETGHEEWFWPGRRRARGLVGDSSWCAVPELDGFRGVVFHQVREPLPVLRSLASLAARPVRRGSPGYYRAIEARVIDADRSNPMTYAMQRYVIFNQTAERFAVRRWRVEEIDAELICEVGAEVGVAIDRARAASAVESMSREINKHEVSLDFGWADLPQGELLDEVVALAERYGYPAW